MSVKVQADAEDGSAGLLGDPGDDTGAVPFAPGTQAATNDPLAPSASADVQLKAGESKSLQLKAEGSESSTAATHQDLLDSQHALALQQLVDAADDLNKSILGRPGTHEWAASVIAYGKLVESGTQPSIDSLVMAATFGDEMCSTPTKGQVKREHYDKQSDVAESPRGSVTSAEGPSSCPLLKKLRRLTASPPPASAETEASSLPSCAQAQVVKEEPERAEQPEEGHESDRLADEDCWDDDLPINPASIDAKFPSGALFASLNRIRATTNSYCLRLQNKGWYNQFKLATVQALLRRLQNQESKISGYHIDCQIGYRQLKIRLHALLDLHKSLKIWVDTQDNKRLVEALPCLRTLLRLFDHMEKAFAPDILLLLVYAQYHRDTMDSGSVAEALAKVDFDSLVEVVNKVRAKEPPVKEEAPEIKEEDQEEAPLIKKELGDNEEPAAKKCTRKSKTQTTAVGLEVVLNFEASAADHLAKLVTDGLKAYLFNVPGKLEDMVKLESVTTELRELSEAWEAATSTVCDEASKKYQDLLKSVLYIYQCCHANEKHRPSAVNVRWARRVVLSAVREQSFAGEAARTMVAYSSGKFAMSAAKSLSAAGLEDEAADTMFASAASDFENLYEHAFSDLGCWLTTGNGGQAHTIKSIGDAQGGVCKLRDCLVNCIPRWSKAAVEAALENLVTAIENSMEIIQVGGSVMVEAVHDRLSDPLAAAAVELSAMDSPIAILGAKQETADEIEASAGADHGAQTTTTGFSVQWLNKMQFVAAAASELRAEVGELASILKNGAQGFVLCCGQLATRLGKGRFSMADTDEAPHRISENIQQNAQKFDTLLDYLELCGALLKEHSEANTGGQPVAEAPTSEKSVLVRFAMHHRALSTDLPSFVMAKHGGGSERMELFYTMFEDFMQGSGAHIYTFFATRFVQESVEKIMSCTVKLASVHEKVLKDASSSKVFPMLIVSPTAKDLSGSSLDSLQGAKFQASAMREWAHNSHFAALEEFVCASGYEEVTIDGVFKHGDGSTVIGSADALTLLESQCLVLDVAMLAAAIHVGLLVKEESKAKVSQASLFDTVAPLISLFNAAIVRLDKHNDTPKVLHFEQEGWVCDMPMSSMRQWTACMGLFGGKVHEAMLHQFVEGLTAATEQSQAACPSWEACVEGGDLKLQVAKKIVAGKLNKLVGLHNSLHQLLVQQNVAAKAMQVSPKLQEHEITSGSVAIALAALARSSQGSVFIQGIDLLLTGANDPKGSEHARSFLKKHRDDPNKNTDLPQSFWKELENLAEHAQVTAPFPPAEADVASETQPPSSSAASSCLKRGRGDSVASQPPAELKKCSSKAPSVKAESEASGISLADAEPAPRQQAKSLKRFKK